MQKPPLLITASLDAGKTPYVALSATMDRVEAHMQGLLAWLGDPSVEKIVFAKNCGAKIHPEVLVEKAFDYGKELEFVQVATSERTIIQGKGYGEGDLIRLALEASDLLRESDDFIKITGKLYCPGVDALFTGEKSGEFFVNRDFSMKGSTIFRRLCSGCYGSRLGSKTMGFLKRTVRVPWGLIASVPGALVDTRLYRVTREFYRMRLGQSYHRVQDALGYTLERAFHDDLEEHIPSVRIITNTTPPIIGTSGSLGTTTGEYGAKIRSDAKELARRLMVQNT
jgi:hypothetical protein